MNGRCSMRCWGLALGLALSSASAWAGTTVLVDDSASQVLDPTIDMAWETPARSLSMSRPAVEGETVVLVRLNVAAWMHQNVRIYLTSPIPPSGPVDVAWTTRGLLQPGALRSGERALVYTGPITTERLEDTFQMTFRADGQRLERTESLSFLFELESASP